MPATSNTTTRTINDAPIMLCMNRIKNSLIAASPPADPQPHRETYQSDTNDQIGDRENHWKSVHPAAPDRPRAKQHHHIGFTASMVMLSSRRKPGGMRVSFSRLRTSGSGLSRSSHMIGS